MPIEHLKNLPVALEQLYNLKYMKFRFGKISLENYEQLNNELTNLDVLILELEKTDKEAWILYFTPDKLAEKVDSYFKVMKFERVWLQQEIIGRPVDILTKAKEQITKTKNNTEDLKAKLIDIREQNGREILNDLLQLELVEKTNKVKKYMAHDNKGSFYIVGLDTKDNLQELLPKVK